MHVRDRGLFWSLCFWLWRCNSVVASHFFSFLDASASHSSSDHALEISCSNIKSCLLWFQWVGNRTGHSHSWVPQTLADTIWILLVEIAICAMGHVGQSLLLVKTPYAVGEVLLVVCWSPAVCYTLVISHSYGKWQFMLDLYPLNFP